MGRDPDRGWHLLGRITRGEWIVAAVVAVTFAVLILLQPDILEAPVQNLRTIVFTVGGTILAAIALVVMLRRGVHPVVRVVVLVVPLIVVSTWLISPFFIDEVVEDEFDTSIAAASDEASGGAGAATSVPATTAPSVTAPAPTAAPPTTSAPSADPVLLGAGRFQGLAGHDGTGDAGIFTLADGHHVVRLENLALENGPDLQLYVVPGADVRSLADGSIHLGGLRGNAGNQTYDLPEQFEPTAGDWTVLVWCRAFEVEFVNATLRLA